MRKKELIRRLDNLDETFRLQMAVNETVMDRLNEQGQSIISLREWSHKSQPVITEADLLRAVAMMHIELLEDVRRLLSQVR